MGIIMAGANAHPTHQRLLHRSDRQSLLNARYHLALTACLMRNLNRDPD